MMPTNQILEIIRQSTGGAECLTFGGRDARWHSVDDWKSFPNEPVVYAIGLKPGVQYEKMVSKIIYFGSTIKAMLRQRMRAYATGGHNDRLQLLQQQFPGCIECSYHVLPELKHEWLLALEDAAMQEAFRSFGCYPICNHRALSARHREACRGLVRILPCEGLSFAQPVGSLNCGDGSLDVSRAPKHGWPKARSRNPDICIKLRTVIVWGGNKEADTERNTPETNPSPAKTENRELEVDNRCWAHTVAVWPQNVAIWSQEKMERIVALCGQLKPAKVRGRSRVITFDAPTRAVPCPETWGEVALLKAREIAGTFYPSTKVWLKVQFGKLLLGQAILESNVYHGEDMSDLPQTNSREEIDMDKQWLREQEAIRGEFPADLTLAEIEFIKRREDYYSNPNFPERLALLRSAHEPEIQGGTMQTLSERIRSVLKSRRVVGTQGGTMQTASETEEAVLRNRNEKVVTSPRPSEDQSAAAEAELRNRNGKVQRVLEERIEARYQAAVDRNLDATITTGECAPPTAQ